MLFAAMVFQGHWPRHAPSKLCTEKAFNSDHVVCRMAACQPRRVANNVRRKPLKVSDCVKRHIQRSQSESLPKIGYPKESDMAGSTVVCAAVSV